MTIMVQIPQDDLDDLIDLADRIPPAGRDEAYEILDRSFEPDPIGRHVYEPYIVGRIAEDWRYLHSANALCGYRGCGASPFSRVHIG